MTRTNPSANEVAFFHRPHAKWVVGVLNMLIAVVGEESLLGLLLRQTRFEIGSLLREDQPAAFLPKAAQYKNN